MSADTLFRDLAILALLIVALLAIDRLTAIDLAFSLRQSYGSRLTLVNRCDLAIAIDSGDEQLLVAPGATVAYQPSAGSNIRFAESPLRLRLYSVEQEIELSGVALPGRSDLYGAQGTLIACYEE